MGWPWAFQKAPVAAETGRRRRAKAKQAVVLGGRNEALPRTEAAVESVDDSKQRQDCRHGLSIGLPPERQWPR
ncbi:hypothetical protein G6O67_003126 [Ophiocordyceps sinensis]|uniref:Uncharacterized protein n=1 Tax=Ophiocordyceps sinensis TaxID=72228 RepID=A0A8H4PW32_9HYPO|nr:hypothetical protein G6O67_003126 [Ophiocordyceps sinensis]